MALLESLSLPIGKQLPAFKLNDCFGEAVEIKPGENPKLVIFTCNHCPYAIAVWSRVIQLAKYATKNNIEVVAINPNIHPSYPADSPENMQKLVKENAIHFPYLVDNNQEIAKDYNAQCTPDIFLLTNEMKLYYHGRIDDNWKSEKDVTSQDLRLAIDSLLKDLPAPKTQYPSMGCSIKWRDN